MAHLAKKGDWFVARFTIQQKEYKKSLKTRNEDGAKTALREVENRIYSLQKGYVSVPDGVDVGDYIVWGDSARKAAEAQPTLSFAELKEVYLKAHEHLKAASTSLTERIHLSNIEALLGRAASRPVNQLRHNHLESALQQRLDAVCSTTVRKERQTLVSFFAWAVRNGYLATSPAAVLPTIKSQETSSPFRTLEEVEEILKRGGLDDAEAEELWDCLYLTQEEISGILDLVLKHAGPDFVHPMFAIITYARCRLLPNRRTRKKWKQTALLDQTTELTRASGNEGSAIMADADGWRGEFLRDLVGLAYFRHVRGFKTMEADAEAVQGDADRVVVRGSQLNDYRRVNPYNDRRETSVVRFLSGSGSVWHTACGLDTIVGYGRGGALVDQLFLNDTPGADTFDVSRLHASLDAPDYGLTVATHGFGTVEVRRTNANGSADEISLSDSQRPDHDDTVVDDPEQVTMSGPGYVNKVLNFPIVKAYSSGEGYDTAYFSDLADPKDGRTGADIFTARPFVAMLEGSGYRLDARLFDQVHAKSNYGVDIANMYGNANAAQLTATATEVRLSSTHSAGSYANHARSFHEVNAFGTREADKAVLTDAAVDPASYGIPEGLVLDDLAQMLWLDGFEGIERQDSATGNKIDDINNIDKVFAWWE